MNLSILYRGPLSSCNYACGYCPFAKRAETRAELGRDRACLERFTAWAAGRTADSLAVLFTPWGEALVRPWYQQALAALTTMPHVRRAAIQTNLSCNLGWVEACDRDSLALWCTYHPGEVPRERFLAKCRELISRSIRFSVGVVGLKEHLADIDALRAELPPAVYLWVNAYKREADYYTAEMVAQLTAVDPHFPTNNARHASLGEPCRAGHQVIAVDGDGVITRCHFIKRPLGNLYEPGFEAALFDRPCTNDTCGCHIGYAHLDRLKLGAVYGPNVLERIPLTIR